MHLSNLVTEIHANARRKGFWDQERNVGEALMLVVTELAEALEAHRSGNVISYRKTASELLGVSEDDFYVRFPRYVKDTFEDEIADSIIRLLDLCVGLNIDIESHILAKMRYNATREKLHGKNY